MAARKSFTREQLERARDTAEKKLGHRANVTGVDVGYRWHGNEPTDELCVRVHVREKLPLSALEAAEVFPAEIDGVPLDVIEAEYKTGRATVPSEHQSRFSVLLSGISVAHKDVTAGTIGALVVDKASGRPALLSNWHVLVGPTGQTGDAILQPGPFDGGRNPGDTVATLGQSLLGADGDAAIGFLIGRRTWLPFVFGTFDLLRSVKDPDFGEVLVKSGRTTGQTRARVDGIGTYFVRYQIRPGTFENKGIKGFKLVSVTPGNPNNEELSSGGDSGCAWYDPDDGAMVGLHFAGETDPNPTAEHAIACYMSRVSQRLNIRLATPEDVVNGLSEESAQERPANVPQLPEPAPCGGSRALADAVIDAYERGRASATGGGIELPVRLRLRRRRRVRSPASEVITAGDVRADVVECLCRVLEGQFGRCDLSQKPSHLMDQGNWLIIGRRQITCLWDEYPGLAVSDWEILDHYGKQFRIFAESIVERIEESG